MASRGVGDTGELVTEVMRVWWRGVAVAEPNDGDP